MWKIEKMFGNKGNWDCLDNWENICKHGALIKYWKPADNTRNLEHIKKKYRGTTGCWEHVRTHHRH